MYYIRIWNKKTDRRWEELFYDYEIFRKRVIKIKYSKLLVITSRSLLEEESYRY